jgi:hypothetical protein
MCVRGLPSNVAMEDPCGGCDKKIIEVNDGFSNKPRLMTPEDL